MWKREEHGDGKGTNEKMRKKRETFQFNMTLVLVLSGFTENIFIEHILHNRHH